MLRPEDEELVRLALSSASTHSRYLALVSPVSMASGCRPWMGAVGGRGHGRFWVCSSPDGRDVVMTAHRAGYAMHAGFDALQRAAVVRHTCDEPICQTPAHWMPGSVQQNALDYLARQPVPGSPLRDRRGSLGRSIALRDAARIGGNLDAVAGAGLPETDRYQSTLF